MAFVSSGLRSTPYSANGGRRALNMLSRAFNAIRVQRQRVRVVFEVRDLLPQTLVGALTLARQ